MSAIWAHHSHRAKGLPSWEHDFRLHSTLRGITRKRSKPKKVKYAITPSDLTSMYRFLDINRQSDLIFWAALILSFRALLQKSHVTPISHCIRARYISFMDDYMILTVRTSKTDQFGQRPQVVTIKSTRGSPLCPVSLLKRVFYLRKPSPTGYVFTLKSSQGLSNMTYSYYNSKLKWLASNLVGTEH